jgi:TolB-like protein
VIGPIFFEIIQRKVQRGFRRGRTSQRRAAAVQAPAAANPQLGPGVASSPASSLSIVVLPFANLSNDPDQEYFTDGITDDLTSDLSRSCDSFVIVRTTAFRYKGKALDVRQIGRELGVRYVIEGSVRRAGVPLIDAESGAPVWADRQAGALHNVLHDPSHSSENRLLPHAQGPR